MSVFNYRRARSKRPCPLWIDAFLRDTMHLGADEVGAYLLILMAMWMREACDLPDDDRRLAKVSRVSLRLWQSRVGPAIRPFFTADRGVLISKRLRQEAEFVERQILGQSNRKTGANTEWEAYALPEGSHEESQKYVKNPDNSLINKKSEPSTDDTRTQPGMYPSYNPTTQHIGGGGYAREAEAEIQSDNTVKPPETGWTDAEFNALLVAVGIDPTQDAAGKWHAPEQRREADRWRIELGLTFVEAKAAIRGAVNGTPPSTLKWFTPPMQRAAGRKSEPKLTAIEHPPHPPPRPRINLEEMAKRAAERNERRQG